jgi:toxin ParE1/3/4
VNVLIRTAAREDILRQYEWYLAEAGESVAGRFLDAVEGAVESLRRMPDLGSPRDFRNPRLAGLRSWPVPNFPAIRLYYIHGHQTLRIVRLLHGKRDVHSMLEEDDAEE